MVGLNNNYKSKNMTETLIKSKLKHEEQFLKSAGLLETNREKKAWKQNKKGLANFYHLKRDDSLWNKMVNEPCKIKPENCSIHSWIK